jgi:hypothetical protein
MFTRMCISLALLATTLALLPFGAQVTAADEPLLVIVGINFPVKDLPLSAIKDAFGGQATTLAGKRLIPVNHPLESTLRVAFDRAILRLEPAAVGRFWVDRRIRAEGMPPTTAATPELAVRIVASLANSISYATKSMLNTKVKAVTIDGKAAGEAGYPLKR